MKKLLKSGICGSMNSAQMHCLLWKSQHWWLLFNEQCINSSHVTPNCMEKKKKKERNMKITNADVAKAQSKRAHNK